MDERAAQADGMQRAVDVLGKVVGHVGGVVVFGRFVHV